MAVENTRDSRLFESPKNFFQKDSYRFQLIKKYSKFTKELTIGKRIEAMDVFEVNSVENSLMRTITISASILLSGSILSRCSPIMSVKPEYLNPSARANPPPEKETIYSYTDSP